MAAYLPIGVVINVGRNNQAFVLGWGEAASSLAEQVEVLGCVHLFSGAGQGNTWEDSAKLIW